MSQSEVQQQNTTGGLNVDLVKGQRVDLTKGDAALKILRVGMGWDAGNNFDLDAWCLLRDANNNSYQGTTGIFYFGVGKQQGKQTGEPFEILNGSIKHTGDNLTGAGDGDDETLEFNLTTIPKDVQEIACFANIHDAEAKRQNFGQVNNAFVRVYNAETNEVKGRYDLSEDFSGFNCMLFGRIYRHENEWKFQPLGKGLNGNINQVATSLEGKSL